jgi:phage baseplate assembly protein W
MESTEPETSSEFADEGTAAHYLLSECLTQNLTAEAYEGEGIFVNPVGPCEFVPLMQGYDPKLVYPVDAEMVEAINRVIASVHDRVATFKMMGAIDVILRAEQRLPIAEITGERNAEGTADITIIAQFDDHSIIEVDDLKYGRGVVVEAEHNGQLQMYALAAVLKYQALNVFRDVVVRIHQPRIREEPTEWKTSLEALQQFGGFARQQATIALRVMADGVTTALSHLNATEDGCRFCRAKVKCPEFNAKVHSTVMGDFQSVDDPAAQPVTPETAPVLAEWEARLPVFMSRVGMVEDWCKAVRARVESKLLAGQAVPGYKLVQGRKGDRKWTLDEGVEKFMLVSGLKPETIYKPKALNTPAVVEKAVKKVTIIVDSHPVPIWSELAKMVKQEPGRPSVAPVDDPREAWQPVSADEFADETGADLV